MPPKLYLTSEAKQLAKLARDRARVRCLVNLRTQIDRWNKAKEDATDEDFAKLLLDR